MPEPAATAASLARDFFHAHAGLPCEKLLRELSNRVEAALLAARAEEREACATICDERSALWAPAADKPGMPDTARREAISRHKEAVYISDAIRTRGRQGRDRPS